jgi:hypothetical protein
MLAAGALAQLLHWAGQLQQQHLPVVLLAG